MGSLSNHVTSTTSLSAVRVRKAEFGVLLLLSANATFAERTKTYTDASELLDDSFAIDGPEYLFAQAFFGETESPDKFKIGRCALPPTQVYTLVPTVQNSHVYSYDVVGEGVTAETVTYTSDATATLAEIIAGLETAFNAVVGKNFTAVDTASTSLVITASAAGDWFSVRPNDLVNNQIAQTHVDPGLATDLTAIENFDSDWYVLATNYNSNACVLAADAWIAGQTKTYVFDCNETDALNTAAGNSDTLDDLATLTRGKTMGAFHDAPGDMQAARWCSARLSKAPGKATWAATPLQGLVPPNLTPSQRANLMARNANVYEYVAGLNVMSYGTTADGDFIDVQRFTDWQNDDMATSVWGAIVAADKISFEDDDLVAIEAEVVGSLARGVTAGGLAKNPAPVVTIPKVATVSTADKLARTLSNVKWNAQLASAIHKVSISGVITP